MVLFLELFVRVDGFGLFNELGALSLVLLLEVCLVFPELLVLGDERVLQYVALALELSDFLLIDLLQAHHGIVDGLDLFVF